MILFKEQCDICIHKSDCNRTDKDDCDDFEVSAEGLDYIPFACIEITDKERESE